MAIDEQRYVELAIPELRRLLEAVDALDDVEAELEADILTVEFSDDTKYVINSHRAARQIWMAADRSAWHFDYDEGDAVWVAAKTGDELWATLARTIAAKLGRAVTLNRAD